MRLTADELRAETRRAAIEPFTDKKRTFSDISPRKTSSPRKDLPGLESVPTMSADREDSSDADNRRFESLQEEGPNPVSGGKLSFLEKTWEMIESSPPNVAEWSADGKSFIVHDPQRFSSEVIPRFFRHSRFTSFVRQLNFYGFHKVRQTTSKKSLAPESPARPLPGPHEDKDTGDDRDIRGRWEFRHDRFLRHNKELMKTILRKTNMRAQAQANIAVAFGGTPAKEEVTTGTTLSRSDMEKMLHGLEDRCHQMQTYLNATSTQLEYLCSFLYDTMGRCPPAEQRTFASLYEQAMMTLRGVQPLLQPGAISARPVARPYRVYEAGYPAAPASEDRWRASGGIRRSESSLSGDGDLGGNLEGSYHEGHYPQRQLLDRQERRYSSELLASARSPPFYTTSSLPAPVPTSVAQPRLEDVDRASYVSQRGAELCTRKRNRHFEDYASTKPEGDMGLAHYEKRLRPIKSEIGNNASYVQSSRGRPWRNDGEIGRETDPAFSSRIPAGQYRYSNPRYSSSPGMPSSAASHMPSFSRNTAETNNNPQPTNQLHIGGNFSQVSPVLTAIQGATEGSGHFDGYSSRGGETLSLMRPSRLPSGINDISRGSWATMPSNYS